MALGDAKKETQTTATARRTATHREVKDFMRSFSFVSKVNRAIARRCALTIPPAAAPPPGRSVPGHNSSAPRCRAHAGAARLGGGRPGAHLPHRLPDPQVLPKAIPAGG